MRFTTHCSLLTVLFLVPLAAFCQEGVPDWIKNIHVSGYGMLQYSAEDKEDDSSNGFALRLARLSLDGRVAGDFAWKVQAQLNHNATEKGTSVALVDLFAEWQKWDFLRVKAGQFKRPFTFENPQHPVYEGFMGYANSVEKLSGFVDRTGEQKSNGRDIGIQLEGDLLKHNGRPLLHYQVAVMNGQGINVKDRNNQKDIIGGLWVMPIEGLRLGAFGWKGSRTGTFNMLTLDRSNNYEFVMTEHKTRYALSAEYIKNDWTFRSEYIHNSGYGQQIDDGRRADGFYALGVVPVIKNKLHAKARYDIFRNEANWAVRKINYEVAVDYWLSPHLMFLLEYARINNHERNYKTNGLYKNTFNHIDAQVSFIF